MRVKICGITTVADAVAAAEAGAWAIGLVFDHRSPRYVGTDVARYIVETVGTELLIVAVFRNSPREYIDRIASSIAVDAVQVHDSGQSIEVSRQMHIHAVSLSSRRDVAVAAAHSADLLLADGGEPGSGKLSDWTLAAELAKGRDIILAGGLTPHNVAAAVREVCPYAVDVSSGVERARGVKDAALIREFIANAHAEVAA